VEIKEENDKRLNKLYVESNNFYISINIIMVIKLIEIDELTTMRH
jgi:hypothetical protein